MSPEEILAAQFQAQLIRFSESGMDLQTFMIQPSELLAEETMVQLRKDVHRDRRANR